MSTPRWTAFPPSDSSQTHCSVVAVQLTLHTAQAGPAVDSWAERVAGALPAPGLLGIMLERTERHLRVVSAWSRRSQMAAFERGLVHLDAKTALRPHLLPPTVVVWTEVVAALPPDWDDVRRRLAAVTPASHGDRRDGRSDTSPAHAEPRTPDREGPHHDLP